MKQYINPALKLFGHLDRLADLRQDGTTRAPVNIEIDLSNRCNLGCAWCHFAHTHTRGPLAHSRKVEVGDLMESALALRLIDELYRAGVRSVTWSGGGEPTLHPDFDSIVAQNLLPQGIYTNGTRLSTTRAALLRRVMRWVYISLDAATAETYRAAKGVDQFEAACDGVRQLAAAPGSATIGVGMLLDSTNWPTAPAMRQLGLSLGADYVQFRPTIRYDRAHPDQACDNDWIHQAWPVLETLPGPGVEIDLNRFALLRDWQGHGYAVCHWTMIQTVITPDGRAWACLNRRGEEAAVLGDLNTESFESLWARRRAESVGATCRVMCRGHLPNLTLTPLMNHQGTHEEFI